MSSVLALGILGWVAVMTRFRRTASPIRRPVAVAALAARCPTTTMATGVRFALTPRGSASFLSRFGAVTLIAAGLVGTLVFAVSLRRLVTEPARYGVNYDAMIDDGSEQVPVDERAVLETDPDIADVNYYTASMTRVEGASATLPSPAWSGCAGSSTRRSSPVGSRPVRRTSPSVGSRPTGSTLRSVTC